MTAKLVKLEENLILYPETDSQFVLDLSDINPEIDYNVEVMFNKPGVQAEIIGLYRLKDNEKLNVVTSAIHNVPNTSCFTKVRGVLHNGAASKYIGKIVIKPEAQQTSSFLDDAVLVVGEGTHNRSDPILEIEADDVSASHGSTTGRIDETQLYYLQSRGLSRNFAAQLIVEGFFQKLLNEIVDEEVRTAVAESLN